MIFVIIMTMKMVLRGNMHLMSEVLYTSLRALSSLSAWWLLFGIYARRLQQTLENKAL
jgi:hypothetical protein